MKPGTNGSHAAVDPRGDGHSVEERLDALIRMIQAWDWRASVAPGSRSRYVTGSLTSPRATTTIPTADIGSAAFSEPLAASTPPVFATTASSNHGVCAPPSVSESRATSTATSSAHVAESALDRDPTGPHVATPFLPPPPTPPPALHEDPKQPYSPPSTHPGSFVSAKAALLLLSGLGILLATVFIGLDQIATKQGNPSSDVAATTTITTAVAAHSPSVTPAVRVVKPLSPPS